MNSYEWFIDFRERRSLRNYQIAEIAGVAPGTVSNWVADRAIPKAVLKVLQAYDATHPLETDQTDQTPHTPPAVQAALTQIGASPLDFTAMTELRLFASLPASTWGEIGETVEMVLVPAHMARGADGAIRVSGHCMEPAIFDGEIMLVKLSESADPGEVVVARNGEGEYTLKRIRLVDGKLLLSADTTPTEAIEASKAQIVAVCLTVFTPAKSRKP